jgi:hypothetical protein
MALRKPLVIVGGQIEQLQSGDTLDAPQAGGDQIILTNDEIGAIVIGNVVYSDTNDGVKKAQANAAATKNVLGLVATTSISAAGTGAVMVAGVLTATTGQWDTVTGGSGGLVAGTKYYLDAATSGKMTSTAPTTVGQYVVELGVALSTTELMIKIQKDILL